MRRKSLTKCSPQWRNAQRIYREAAKIREVFDYSEADKRARGVRRTYSHEGGSAE